MNLSHFLAVLRARWLSAVVVFAVVLAAAILYLVFATRVYTATASLLIDVKPDPVSSMLYGGATPSQINTQIEILRSDRVAQRVAQNLKLADLADMRAAWAVGQERPDDPGMADRVHRERPGPARESRPAAT